LTITLKMKFSDFTQITRSQSEGMAIGSHEALGRASLELLAREMPVPQGVRLLGVSLSNLEARGQDQARSLFGL
jgi:DNA polymerase-4